MACRYRWPLLTLLLLANLVRPGSAAAQEPTTLASRPSDVGVRITSPLGRIGVTGTVRIVAQVLAPNPIRQVLFYVNAELLAAVTDGPPYAVEWIDENPFGAREIVVDAQDALGNVGRDTIILEPLEILEVSGVTSVLLEVSVQGTSGRAVRGLDASKFVLTENGVPQVIDMVSEESMSATLAMLIDSSQSTSRRIDFVRRTAERLSGFLGSKNRMLVVPFTRTLGSITGPTTDRMTIVEALSAIRPVGGTAIVDSIVATCKLLENAEGRRAIVLVTDGYDEHSTGSIEDAIIAARAAHVTIYVFGVGGVAGISLKGERLLRRLAQEAGGLAFFPMREDQLQAAHSTLIEDLEN